MSQRSAGIPARWGNSEADQTCRGTASDGGGGGPTAVPTPPPPTPPWATTAFYVDDISPNAMYNFGCGLRITGQTGLTILDFGRAAFDSSSGTYGSKLVSNDEPFVSTSQIEAGVDWFLAGYWNCPGGINGSLVVGVGTNNGGSQVTLDHGAHWAALVNNLSLYIYSQNWNSILQVAGAVDFEPEFGLPADAFEWENGYDSVNQQPYYNFGSADGCSATEVSGAECDCPDYDRDINGNCLHPWYQHDFWRLSWGLGPALSIPDIYLTDGVNAGQWQKISLDGTGYSQGHIVFSGAFSQFGACAQRVDPAGEHDCEHPCCTDNNPGDAWRELLYALNSDARTSQALRWSTDIQYTDCTRGAPC